MLEALIRACALILIPIFLPIEPQPLVIEQSIGLKYAQLAIISIKAVFSTDPWAATDANNTMVRTMALHLVRFSLSKADYYSPLVVFLEGMDDYAAQSASRITTEDMQKTELLVLDYLQVRIYLSITWGQMLITDTQKRIQTHSSPILSLRKAHKVWDGLTERWASLGHFDTVADRLQKRQSDTLD